MLFRIELYKKIIETGKNNIMKLFVIIAILFLGGSSMSVIAAQPAKIKVGLIGDSTVATTYGWGPAFAEKVEKNVIVLNYAKNGATLESLSKKLDELLKAKPDYVLVQFGHNDMKVYDTKVYGVKLKDYVERIKQAGAKAIVLSSVTRRNFDKSGKIVPRVFNDNHSQILPKYASMAKAVAKEEQVPFIDLYSISLAHHNKLGVKEVGTYNHKKTDTTHFSPKGGKIIADMVIKELKRVVPDLCRYFDKNTKPVKVFLLGGQSNMVGQYYKGGLKPPYSEPFAKVKIWCYKRGKWMPVAPTHRVGPDVSFGHAIAKALPDENIRLIKYAINGTSLYKQWAPTTGPMYIGFMKAAKGALADLENKQVPYKIAGMLWLQGESDAVDKKGAAYEKNLSAFIKHMREKFKSPDMPFIIARVRNFYGKGAQAQMVRKAQQDLAEKMKNVAWFDTDDLNPLINGGHYNLPNTIEIGNRFAGKYTEISSKSKGCRK
jgi:lysophospholipase L1-like esterase